MINETVRIVGLRIDIIMRAQRGNETNTKPHMMYMYGERT